MLRLAESAVAYPADPQYPKTYPAVPRAARVNVTATNPTAATFDVLPFLFGVQFADVPGSFEYLVGNPDATTRDEQPRLMAPNARIEWHEAFRPTQGTQWPADARLTTAVRCPSSNPSQTPGNVSDEVGQWIGVPAKRT
jgi:hypothetical protein